MCVCVCVCMYVCMYVIHLLAVPPCEFKLTTGLDVKSDMTGHLGVEGRETCLLSVP